MTRKKRKTKPKSKKDRSPGRLTWVFWSGFLVIFFLSAYWLVSIDKKIVEQFEGRKWAVPAHVYSRPIELYIGLKLEQAAFVKQLEALGYRRVNELKKVGSYLVVNNSVSLITRPHHFWKETQGDLEIRLEFEDGRLRRISDLRSVSNISEFRLEPQLIGSLRLSQHEDRDIVKLSTVPQDFISALLSTEDRYFLHHNGINFMGIARAMLVNLKAGKFVQGGSTITQQLVKNFYLTSERTLKRKFKEMIMAAVLEFRYTKYEILETYLNEVYLGQAGKRAIHGFALASQFYFGRPIQELDVHEYTLLVGMLKGPSYYNPFKNSERASARRNLVIEIMREQLLISDVQTQAYKQLPLGVNKSSVERKNFYPGFLDLVRRQLSSQYDDKLLQSEGFSIYTTLDLNVQNAAENALTQTIETLEKTRQLEAGKLQGAIVVIKADTGEVLAITADRDATFSGFNRALDARRAIGSLAKPAVYLSALERNYNLVSQVADSPLTVVNDTGKKWSPQNYDKQYHGNVSLIDALAYSYNIPAVRVGMDVGVETVTKTMARLGLVSEIEPYPSVMLGASTHTPLEVAQMFQSIANGGFRSPLRSIFSVLSSENQPLDHYPLRVEVAARPGPAYLLDYALQQVVKKGTARALSSQFPKNYSISGKTGTTDAYRDSWFAGYAGNKVAVVWLGYDDNTSTGLSGSTGALKVWANLFKQLQIPEWPNTPPPDVRFINVNYLTGLPTENDCKQAISIPFVNSSIPQGFQSCDQQLETLSQAKENIRIHNKQSGIVGGVKSWIKGLFGGANATTKIHNKTVEQR